MILGIIVILLVGLVAYFHYMQGLLSGVISAVCAIVAAALALGFHENVIEMIAQGKMADHTNALVLVGMFALIYLILRVIFDKFIPGNIRFPAIADKIGGAAMGLIAGIMGIGILLVAAQTLPLGPSIAGYSRWELEDREVKIPTGRGPQQDAYTRDEMKSSDPIKSDDHGAGLILPVDDMVLSFVNKLSDGGSLAGERTLFSVHPSYNDESFFQRLGIQIGAKHVAMNTAKQKQADVEGVYIIQHVPQGEAEIGEIRKRDNLKPLASNPQRAIIAIRVQFTDNATDSDKRIRLAPVGVRLVANGKNYFPLGTLDAQSGVVYANKPDDFLLIEPNKPVDFVFDVAREDVLKSAGGGKANDKELEVADGVFVEVKRLVRAGLGGKKISTTIESSESGVIRKTESGGSKVEGVPLNAGAPAAAETPATTPATKENK